MDCAARSLLSNDGSTTAHDDDREPRFCLLTPGVLELSFFSPALWRALTLRGGGAAWQYTQKCEGLFCLLGSLLAYVRRNLGTAPGRYQHLYHQ